MSAVVIALSTPYYSIADARENFLLQNLPEGEYELRVWIEGMPQSSLDKLKRRVEIRAGGSSEVTIKVDDASRISPEHLNKFGRPYDPDSAPPY
jgi:hypothetical protein